MAKHRLKTRPGRVVGSWIFLGIAIAVLPTIASAQAPPTRNNFITPRKFDERSSAPRAHQSPAATANVRIATGSILDTSYDAVENNVAADNNVEYEQNSSNSGYHDAIGSDGNYLDSCECGNEGCDTGCCDDYCCEDFSDCNVCCSQPCGPGRGFWVGGEYLLWRLDGTALPPLVTESPSSTPPNEAGRLDEPTTTIIGGNNVVGGDWRSGYRLFAGVYLDPCRKWALSGDYFNAGSDDYDFISTPSDDTIVTRPYFNSQTGAQDVEFVSVPDELDGTARVNAGDEFQGAGLTLQRCVYSCCDPCGCGPSTQVALLGGYRYYEYDSQLGVTENLIVLDGTTQPLIPGTTFLVQDSFNAQNQFHGGELGLQARRIHGNFWWDGAAKLAIGTNRRIVTVSGQTVTTVPGSGTDVAAGGLLTSEVTNIGQYTDSTTVVIPDFRLGVGAMLTNHLSVRAGYRVIIWADVARAADHLPPGLAVDPRNIPPVQPGGGPDPIFPGIQGTQLVAHGFDFGVEFTY